MRGLAFCATAMRAAARLPLSGIDPRGHVRCPANPFTVSTRSGYGCTGCWSGFSQPFDEHGDTAQFHLLLHHEVTDCIAGDGDGMSVALERCPQRFAEWIADQIRTGRPLSRQVLQAKAASHLLGTLLDD